MPGLNLEFSDSQGPFPTQQNPHVAISLIIACVGIPALLSSTQTPTRSHSLVPGVHTSNQICPLEDAPKEKACTGLGSRCRLLGWRILPSSMCLKHGLEGTDADLGPWTSCPVVSSMQGPGQGLTVVLNTNDDKVLSCRLLSTL